LHGEMARLTPSYQKNAVVILARLAAVVEQKQKRQKKKTAAGSLHVLTIIQSIHHISFEACGADQGVHTRNAHQGQVGAIRFG